VLQRPLESEQYASRQFAELCDELGVIRSHGAVGTSADNAAAEAFNATLKRETLQGAKRWPSPRNARLAVFRWATRYNTRRLHSALDYYSPIEYELRSATLAIESHNNRCPRLSLTPLVILVLSGAAVF
jgi:transposase InsO family protein